jgi:AraC-like DNA-binding protein
MMLVLVMTAARYCSEIGLDAGFETHEAFTRAFKAMSGIVHDDPDVTPPEKVRYDAAIAVNRPVHGAGRDLSTPLWRVAATERVSTTRSPRICSR